MFLEFFYLLRAKGLDVSINEWMLLVEALDKGLAESSLTGFYNLCRSILIKTEADYDKFDAVFAEYFKGIQTPEDLPEEFWKWLNESDRERALDDLGDVKNMPKELEEAAMIDGCGAFKTYFSIMLPNAKTILLTGLIFSGVWYYNDYYLNTMFADKHSTLTVALSHLSMAIGEFVSLSDQQLIMIRVQAGCLLVILPPMLIFFFVQKKFTEGIERSGIVG